MAADGRLMIEEKIKRARVKELVKMILAPFCLSFRAIRIFDKHL